MSSKTGAAKNGGLRIIKGKMPLRRVDSSPFFELGDDGSRYHTHDGEYIEVLPTVRLDTVLMAQEWAGLQDMFSTAESLDQETTDPTEALAAIERIKGTLYSLADKTAAAIVNWTWTDQNSSRLPSPPTGETIRGLGLYELMYLTNAVFSGGKEAAEERLGNLPDSMPQSTD